MMLIIEASLANTEVSAGAVAKADQYKVQQPDPEMLTWLV